MRSKIAAIAILVLGSAAAMHGQKPAAGPDTRIHYTITSIIYGKSVLNQYKDRLVKANGDWREITTYLDMDGKPYTRTTMYGLGGKGVLKLHFDTHEIEFIGWQPAGYKPRKPKLTDGSVLGEAVVAGEHVIRKRIGRGVEIDFNDDGIMLKIVDEDSTFEAITVEHGKFPAIEPLPNWPITTTPSRPKTNTAAPAAATPKVIPK